MFNSNTFHLPALKPDISSSTALSSQLSSLSSQPSALSSQPSALSPQPSALKSQPSALSPQVSALSSQVSALSSQLSSLSSQLSSLSSQLSALKSQLSALSSQPSALSSQVSALSSQPSALSPQLSALSSQLSSFTCPKGTQFSHPLGLRDATPARAGASSADLSDHLRATRATSHLYTFTLLYIHTLLHEKRIRTSRQRPWPKTRTLWQDHARAPLRTSGVEPSQPATLEVSRCVFHSQRRPRVEWSRQTARFLASQRQRCDHEAIHHRLRPSRCIPRNA
jgi:chaperonin cofactor prefoldin